MPVWLMLSSPKKTIYLFGSLRGALVVSKVLLAFSWYPKLLAIPMMSPVESSRAWISCTLLSSKNARGRFVRKPKFSGDLFLTVTAKSWWQILKKKQLPKIVGKLVEKLRMSWTSGTVIPKFSACLKLGNICSFDDWTVFNFFTDKGR